MGWCWEEARTKVGYLERTRKKVGYQERTRKKVGYRERTRKKVGYREEAGMLSRPRAQVSLRDGAVGGGAWCLDRGRGPGAGVDGLVAEGFWKWGAGF